MKTFALKIVSPEEELYNTEAGMVVVCGKEGEFGILAAHTPLLSLIRRGKLRLLNKQEEWQEFELSGGFLEVSEQGVTILGNGQDS